jgi:Ser-tRNA(Ala) deacylase AlaX
MPTELDYLADMQRLEGEGRVQRVDRRDDGRSDVLLDRTIFYPQGGGQPFDQGRITSDSGSIEVSEVRFVEGEVHHIGEMTGEVGEGQSVRLMVEPTRRELHSRVHSAGHVVDMAVLALGLDWIPGKGYHFPDGPYVEYSGSAGDRDREQLRAGLEREANRFVQERRATEVRFVPKEEMAALCHFVPQELPAGKPQRVVLYGDFGVPCGGTHVANLGDIGRIVIRKLKPSGQTIRVSYAVA